MKKTLTRQIRINKKRRRRTKKHKIILSKSSNNLVKSTSRKSSNNLVKSTSRKSSNNLVKSTSRKSSNNLVKSTPSKPIWKNITNLEDLNKAMEYYKNNEPEKYDVWEKFGKYYGYNGNNNFVYKDIDENAIFVSKITKNPHFFEEEEEMDNKEMFVPVINFVSRKEDDRTLYNIIENVERTNIEHAEGPITEDDVLFMDAKVCILKPNIKKGVLIFHNFTQPQGVDICQEGLKTKELLNKEKELKTDGHSYIFFRAPYISQPIDYTSIETEIESLFGKLDPNKESNRGRVFIRVDPNRTKVYAGEMRIKKQFQFHSFDAVASTEKSMVDFFVFLKKNDEKYKDFLIEENQRMKDLEKPYLRYVPMWNINNGEFTSVSSAASHTHLMSHNANENYEIIVDIQHMSTDFFVKCSLQS
jgi:hypothetical protein